MHDHQSIGDVERHVQRLPDARRQEGEPVVMTGRRHHEQDEQRTEADRLEGEVEKRAVAAPLGQLATEVSQIALHDVPGQQQREMRRRHQEGQHAEMAPVIEQRQETRAEPRQRADAEDDGQHQKGAEAGRLQPDVDGIRQVLGWVPVQNDDSVADDENYGGNDDDGVVDQLGPIPLYGAETDAHCSSPYLIQGPADRARAQRQARRQRPGHGHSRR